MKTLIALIPALVISIGAHADTGRWKPTGNISNDIEFYVDPGSFRKVGGRPRIWAMMSYTPESRRRAGSFSILYEVDCEEGTTEGLQWLVYSGAMGTGSVTDLGRKQRNYPAPGSFEEGIVQGLCAVK